MRMSGRLDVWTPQKKTSKFFELLKKVRENSNIASLDVWTPKKRVEWKVRSSGRLDPKNRLDEFLTFQAQYDNYEVSSSIWQFEALELNMTIWFGRFDQLTTWKKVFAFFGGYYMLSSSIWPLTWEASPKSGSENFQSQNGLTIWNGTCCLSFSKTQQPKITGVLGLIIADVTITLETLFLIKFSKVYTFLYFTLFMWIRYINPGLRQRFVTFSKIEGYSFISPPFVEFDN